jgi:hypothetical protein
MTFLSNTKELSECVPFFDSCVKYRSGCGIEKFAYGVTPKIEESPLIMIGDVQTLASSVRLHHLLFDPSNSYLDGY